MDYKNTINLLETAFPMRGDLAKREPLMLEKWTRQQRYQQIRQKCKNRQKFILHDGPPYANGQLHIGHASNKILKDIIIRFKTLDGFDAPFIPGWDCHGLPIELNIEKQFGKNLPPKQFRDKCREYATQQIELQKADFIRLGVLGDWNNPYRTMDYVIEANIVRALGEIYKNGYIYRGVKPVHWCIECQSALAEAEVEYQDKESQAIYVKFAIASEQLQLEQSQLEQSRLNQSRLVAATNSAKSTPPLTGANKDSDVALDINNPTIIDSLLKFDITTNTFKLNEIFKNTYALIWTTTPWTLPANRAICLGAEIEYALVKVADEYLLVANDLIKIVLPQEVIENNAYEIIATSKGHALEGLMFNHPFYDRVVPLITGEHVTTDAGTGLVHTAPAHGLEDYHAALGYNLDLHNPVGDDGKFISGTELFAGLSVWAVNKMVVEVLQQHSHLFSAHKLVHSYPHCWRHKTPLIFRTTSQWFIGMDKIGVDGMTLRSLAQKAVDNTKFFPQWGRARLEAMIKSRPDWCISRQRNWGVPMPFFVHKETKELHPDSYVILQQVVDLIAKNGIDAWFDVNLTAQSLAISDYENYQKLSDTLDVWFDSGTTHFSVLHARHELGALADLYLEGSDQHRGWFQSSLLTSCAINQVAPYKQLLTHGFLVDGQGYKMSKSKGNITSIPDAVNKYGADILRLWVASTDYSGDIAFSTEIMKHITDSYRRIRNTLRFLLANLVDFDIQSDAVAIDELVEVDKYALIRLNEIQDKVVKILYPEYQFHLIVQELVNFCSEDLGGFYLDILKDRLYTAKSNIHARRSAQTALYHLACSLVLMLSPILCFTADEAWEELQHNELDSTLYHTFYKIPRVANANEIAKHYGVISQFRGVVLKELENSRSSGKIGSSLQANLIINADKNLFDTLSILQHELKFIYMVSDVALNLSDQVSVEVIPSAEAKCERCWHYSATVGSNVEHGTICSRCVENVFGSGEVRHFA